MHHQVIVLPDPASLAVAAADHVAARAVRSVASNGRFHFAVSGGSTPRAMFEQLSDRDMPWSATTIYQVDERIAPIDDPDRNLSHLTDALAGVPATVVAMPVEDPDPDVAAQQYAEHVARALRPGAPGTGSRRTHCVAGARRRRPGGQRPTRWSRPRRSTWAADA